MSAPQIVVNHFNGVVRLYDSVRDNPLEVTVGRHGDNVVLVVEDRDAGTQESITLDEAQLQAALALTRFGTVCEDCHTSPGIERGRRVVA